MLLKSLYRKLSYTCNAVSYFINFLNFIYIHTVYFDLIDLPLLPLISPRSLMNPWYLLILCPSLPFLQPNDSNLWCHILMHMRKSAGSWLIYQDCLLEEGEEIFLKDTTPAMWKFFSLKPSIVNNFPARS